MKLIEKSALVAEIEKLNPPFYPTLAEKMSYQDAIKDCIDIIHTLEVKEVDIDKLCEFRKNIGFAYPDGASEYQKQLACYRQGIKDAIKAQKGEKV